MVPVLSSINKLTRNEDLFGLSSLLLESLEPWVSKNLSEIVKKGVHGLKWKITATFQIILKYRYFSSILEIWEEILKSYVDQINKKWSFKVIVKMSENGQNGAYRLNEHDLPILRSDSDSNTYL